MRTLGPSNTSQGKENCCSNQQNKIKNKGKDWEQDWPPFMFVVHI